MSLRGSETNLKLFWLSFSGRILRQTLAASAESALGTVVCLCDHSHRAVLKEITISLPSFNAINDFSLVEI